MKVNREVAGIKKRFDKSFIAVTPGIRPKWSLLENNDQKRITTQGQAISLGSDFIVVRRPIKDASNPAKAAQKAIKEIEDSLKLAFCYSLSRLKAECSVLTASSAYFARMTHDILISEVLISLMLIFSSASAWNIVAATPE